MNALFPFQHESVQFLKERKYALLALEQGLGKTIVAIAAAKELREEKMLVVCPSSVKYNWEREIKAWDPSASVYIINGSTWKSVSAKYTIINYDIIHKPGIARHLLKMQFNVLILDEAHYLKNSRAKRTKTVYSQNGLADKAVRVWLMTGTPVLNRPVEIFPMLRRFMPERLGKYADYMAFTRRFCGGYQGKWGWDDRGATHLDELSKYLDGFMLRRLKKDVMKDLPDKTYQKIIFDAPTADVRTLVKREREQYKEETLGTFSTLRQEVGLAKLPMVVEHLENLLEETDKIIIFAHHRKVLEELKRRLKAHNPVLLYGGLTALQKQKTVDDFVTDRNKRVFLGQIDAAGIGIDGLQKVANTVVFAEISWVPGQIKQAIDRCHRIGQENKVLVQFLMMKGGIDEQIYDSVAHKSLVIKKVVDMPGNTRTDKKEEEVEMALEQNIERIATALERLADAAEGVRNTAAETTGTPTPVSAAPKAKAAVKPAAGTMDAKGLLAYANKQILAIKDPAARKETVQAVMAAIKEQIGVANIAQVPADKVEEAKTIVDQVLAQGPTADETALL